MVDLPLLQSISYMAGALGVCIAAIFYVLNLRISQRNMKEAERNKKIQLSISIADKLGSKEFRRDYIELWQLDWKDTDDFMKKYDSSANTEASKEHWAQRYSVWIAYDNLGYLLREGLVDDEVVFNSAGNDCVTIWHRYWPIIDYYRRTQLGQRLLENFEFLAKTMYEMGKARGRVSPEFKGDSSWDTYKDVFEPKAAGSMLKNNMINAEVLHDHGGDNSIWMWAKFESIIRHNRKVYHTGDSFLWGFEYLAGEMMKVAKMRDPSFKIPDTFMMYVPE